MKYEERSFSFPCNGDSLVGIAAVPEASATIGVLVIVGGPQYRIGSHRQFVLLARALATAGLPCMRFDYRGMGDATGEPRTFEAIAADIRAAADAFSAHVPGVSRIVLWGLCDAAVAAGLYAPQDSRVAGVVLLNPDIRTATSAARISIEKYYRRRLLDPAFWRKTLGGRLAVRKTIGDLVRSLRLATASSKPSDDASLGTRLRRSLQQMNLPALVILSGQDYVANQFEQIAAADPQWSEWLTRAAVEHLEAADHTFSTEVWRDRVAETTATWVRRLTSPARS